MYQQQFQRPFSNMQQQQPQAQSQYRGFQRQYQPVGYVQSSYQGNPQSQYGQQQFSQFNQYGHPQNPEAYHTSNYVGSTPDHDRAFREDSLQPAGFGFQGNQYQQFQPQYNSASTTAHIQNIRPSAFPTSRYMG